MSRGFNLTGQRFNHLTVLEKSNLPEHKAKHETYWKCQCDCGKICYSTTSAIKRGFKRSCGCFKWAAISKSKTRHGDTNSRLYKIWCKMKSRCQCQTNISYKNYGKRGIKVCEEWQIYENFRDWALSNGYEKDLSIDRIDVNGNYEPSNCRWATPKEQSNNKTNNHYITYNNMTKTIAEWSTIMGIASATICARIKNGWSEVEAITKPVKIFVKNYYNYKEV